MVLVNKDTKLHDIVIGEPSVITVLRRFGITLGVGDTTVRQVCDERGIDPALFLAILNTFINPDYFPGNALRACDLTQLTQYMRKTDDHYLNVLIPNVERHFNLLVRQSREPSSNLELMLRFFLEVKAELTARISRDSETLSQAAAGLQDLKATPLESDAVEEKLSDLISMFVIHLKGDYDANLCHAVLFAIANLLNDIRQNNRIRTRILMPALSASSAS